MLDPFELHLIFVMFSTYFFGLCVLHWAAVVFDDDIFKVVFQYFALTVGLIFGCFLCYTTIFTWWI